MGDSYLRRLLPALDKQDLPQFFATLDIFFANVDYDLQIDHEKYYQTIFYLIFLLLGVRVHAEVKTNRGRIDAVIEIKNRIFLFEFKLDGSADEALQQIREHEYAQKYRLSGKPLTLVGVNFNRFKRQIGELIGEEYEELLELATWLRNELKAQGVGYNDRRDLMNGFLSLELVALLREGNRATADRLAYQVLNSAEARTQ